MGGAGESDAMRTEWSGGLSPFFRRRIVTAALEIVAKSCGVEYSDVAASRRKAPVAFARQLAMYLCYVVGDMSLKEVASDFRRDRTTVSHACHSIEDRRDCPIFDRQIEHLEKSLRRRMRKMVAEAIAEEPEGEKKSLSWAG